MFEVEVKARMHSSYADLLTRLEQLHAEQEKAVYQVDTLFLPKGLSYGDIIPGMAVLRVRDQNGKIFFCVKRKPISQSIAIEHETIVENADELTRILENINFAPILVIKKKRQVFKLGQLNICADEIEKLGVFIEVEQLINDESDAQQTLANLWKFLEELGVKEADRVTKGYDSLIYQLEKEKNH